MDGSTLAGPSEHVLLVLDWEKASVRLASVCRHLSTVEQQTRLL